MPPGTGTSMSNCQCVGCAIRGTFECVSSMNVKSLMTQLGLTLLEAQNPDPSVPYNGPTKDPEKLDEELEKRFKDWRYAILNLNTQNISLVRKTGE